MAAKRELSTGRQGELMAKSISRRAIALQRSALAFASTKRKISRESRIRAGKKAELRAKMKAYSVISNEEMK